MIKIYGQRQPKNKNLFEIVITLKKAKTNKPCSLFSNKLNIKG